MLKIARNWKIFVVSIFVDIYLKFCPVVVHILNKDISYSSKLSESKNESFWGKIFKFRA